MPRNKKDTEDKELFSPLDEESFKDRMGETFRSINVTLVSIVQGVSLGILIFNTADIFFGRDFSKEYYIFLMYPLFSFTGIMVITFEYSHYVGIYKRTVIMSDVFFPYLLGVTQSLPMFFINDPEMWWLFEAGLMGAAGLAWNNTRRFCTVEVFGDNELARKRYHRSMVHKSLSGFVMLVMCVLCSYLISTAQNFQCEVIYQVAFGLVLCGWASWLLISSQKLLSKLHEDFGFSPLRWI